MASTDNRVLEVVGLTKTFRDFWGRESVKALDDVNFDVKRGEVFGLLGPNGSGKTTTIRIILGLLFPTHGAVRLFERSPRSVEVKKRIGYMPEESHLYPYLTAEETLDFFGRLFRLPKAERQHRTDALIEMVGLKRARNRAVGQYSKGMARRMGLAQSLINDPDLLILDEPTTGLDPIGTREIKDLILTLRERGKTILLCSHLLNDVEDVCDRICILYGGRQRALGTVDELLTKHNLTQIRAPRLEAGALDRIINIIHETTGNDGPVEVSNPTKRLEEFFLSVVEEAQRERLATAGAERGTAAASFLSGEEQGQKLVEELVQASQQEEQAAQEGPELVAAIPLEQDQALINDLVRKGTGEETDRETEAPAAAVAPETGVRESVLEDLLTDGSQDGEADDKTTP